MSAVRRGLLSAATVAAGALVGAAVEELVYRAALGRAGLDDPAEAAPRGRRLKVEAFDGTAIAVESSGPGDADAIVFVHGYTLSGALWRHQVSSLCDRYRVITYDARGHGDSGPVRGPDGRTQVTMAVLARDLRHVLDAAGVSRCVLAGHSMGGMTVLQLAEIAPEEFGSRVVGLGLVNTSFTGSMHVFREDRPGYQAARAAVGGVLEAAAASSRVGRVVRWPSNDLMLLLTRGGFGRSPSPSQVTFVHEMMRRTPGDTLTAALAAVGSFEAVHVLDTIRVPTLIVAGERDVLTPPWVSARMAQAIAGSELVVLPGVGHVSMLERHAEVTRRLDGLARRALTGRRCAS